MKKLLSLILAAVIAITVLTACQTTSGQENTYTVGICNFVDDASLNQIIANIRAQLEKIGKDKKVTFNVIEQNCNMDSNVLSQIITDFQTRKVDLMVAVATPVAIAMQNATEDSKTPVVFAAVSDPVGSGVVASLEKPGANLTGTSDFLNTEAVLKLIFAKDPEAKNVALLYNVSEDASAAPIKTAKEFLTAKGVSFKEYTGTNTSEIGLAVDAIIADKCDAVFTPTDNTVMAAELSIYEKLADAGIPHYAGADSFALNGAFLGYGVDYANLGVKTADMIAEILVDGKKPADVPVQTFDNGTATVNTDICEKLGVKYDDMAELFKPFCTKVQSIKTAESFE